MSLVYEIEGRLLDNNPYSDLPYAYHVGVRVLREYRVRGLFIEAAFAEAFLILCPQLV